MRVVAIRPSKRPFPRRRGWIVHWFCRQAAGSSSPPTVIARRSCRICFIKRAGTFHLSVFAKPTGCSPNQRRWRVTRRAQSVTSPWLGTHIQGYVGERSFHRASQSGCGGTAASFHPQGWRTLAGIARAECRQRRACDFRCAPRTVGCRPLAGGRANHTACPGGRNHHQELEAVL